MFHDYDHGLGLFLGNQVVHDVAQFTLGAPSGLILAGSVEQVKHWETAVRLFLVLRRQIYPGGTLGTGQLGLVLYNLYLAVRDLLFQIIIYAGLRNVNTALPVVRAVELFTVAAPVFPSKGEMRKMVQGGGVSLNKEKLTDQNRPITADDLIDGKYLLAQKGKKNYYLLIVK